MPSIIKVKGPAVDVTTANTVNNAVLVRIYSQNGATITIIDPVASTTLGSFIMPTDGVEYVEKKPTDTITADVLVSATPVSYNT